MPSPYDNGPLWSPGEPNRPVPEVYVPVPRPPTQDEVFKLVLDELPADLDRCFKSWMPWDEEVCRTLLGTVAGTPAYMFVVWLMESYVDARLQLVSSRSETDRLSSTLHARGMRTNDWEGMGT